MALHKKVILQGRDVNDLWNEYCSIFLARKEQSFFNSADRKGRAEIKSLKKYGDSLVIDVINKLKNIYLVQITSMKIFQYFTTVVRWYRSIELTTVKKAFRVVVKRGLLENAEEFETLCQTLGIQYVYGPDIDPADPVLDDTKVNRLINFHLSFRDVEAQIKTAGPPNTAKMHTLLKTRDVITYKIETLMKGVSSAVLREPHMVKPLINALSWMRAMKYLPETKLFTVRASPGITKASAAALETGCDGSESVMIFMPREQPEI